MSFQPVFKKNYKDERRQIYSQDGDGTYWYAVESEEKGQYEHVKVPDNIVTQWLEEQETNPKPQTDELEPVKKEPKQAAPKPPEASTEVVETFKRGEYVVYRGKVERIFRVYDDGCELFDDNGNITDGDRVPFAELKKRQAPAEVEKFEFNDYVIYKGHVKQIFRAYADGCELWGEDGVGPDEKVPHADLKKLSTDDCFQAKRFGKVRYIYKATNGLWYKTEKWEGVPSWSQTFEDELTPLEPKPQASPATPKITEHTPVLPGQAQETPAIPADVQAARDLANKLLAAGKLPDEGKCAHDLAQALRRLDPDGDPKTKLPAVVAFQAVVGKNLVGGDEFFDAMISKWKKLESFGENQLSTSLDRAIACPRAFTDEYRRTYNIIATTAYYQSLTGKPFILAQNVIAARLNIKQSSVSGVLDNLKTDRVLSVIDGHFDHRSKKAILYGYVFAGPLPAPIAVEPKEEPKPVNNPRNLYDFLVAKGKYAGEYDECRWVTAYLNLENTQGIGPDNLKSVLACIKRNLDDKYRPSIRYPSDLETKYNQFLNWKGKVEENRDYL